MPTRMRRPSARAISAKRDAARSLIPLSLAIPADSRTSCVAASSSEGSTPLSAPSASRASASDLTLPIPASAAQSLRLMTDSSTVLAIRMVQVANEARASPLITIFTRMSADRNMDQGDSSCGTTGCDFSSCEPPASTGTAAEVAGAGAAGPAAGELDGNCEG